jgi:hypothetical protein
MTELEQYHELCFYTLGLGDGEFIHQNVVDAYTAQTADAATKAISLVFALAGLYLAVEKGYTGKEVQLAHLRMAANKRPWPVIPLPEKRGIIRVADVLACAPGQERDNMIRKWCVAVWEAYEGCRDVVVDCVEGKKVR